MVIIVKLLYLKLYRPLFNAVMCGFTKVSKFFTIHTILSGMEGLLENC